MQDSAGWKSATDIGFAGLPAGIPLVVGMLAKLAEQLTGIDVSTWIEQWEADPTVGALGGIVQDALASIFTVSANLQSLFTDLNFLDPDFDPAAALSSFSHTITELLNPAALLDLLDPSDLVALLNPEALIGKVMDLLDPSALLDLLDLGDIAADWGELFENITGIGGGGITDLADLLSGGLFGNINPGRISHVPTGAIGTDSANLFDNPGFDGAISMPDLYGWTWDGTFGHTSVGSARIVADGTEHTLYTNPVTVDVNQTLPMGAWVHYTGLTATPGQNALRFSVQAYEGTGPAASFVSETMVKGILSPSGSSSNAPENNFIHLEDTYTVPAGINEIRGVCKVTPAATAGVIHWDDAHAQTTRLLPIPFIDGLPTQLTFLTDFGQGIVDNIANALGHLGSGFDFTDLFDIFGPGNIPPLNIGGIFGGGNIGTNIQDFIDMGIQALSGGLGTGYFLADWKQALQFIPPDNVTGAGGMPNVRSTFTSMWDLVTSALRLDDIFGTDITNLASASQDVSFTSLNSGILSGAHEVTLGYRTNNPISGAMERTAVANFDWTLLGTGATPANFTVTQANSVGGLIRMPNSDTKGTIFWRSIYTGSITGFYINVGKINDTTGVVDHIYQTPNLAGNLTTTWSWDYYQPPTADRIVHGPDDGLVIEFQVVGSGTLTIAGLDFAWASDNFPGAISRKPGITRATAGTHPTLALSAAQFTAALTTKTPWLALGRADVPITYHPPEAWESVTAGAFTYPIPGWAQVAGTIIDYWAIGGGGGGQSGGYFVTAEGGSKATWISGSLVYGTDIPLGTTQLTGTVADNASGGINPFALDPGDNGTATTINGIGGGFSTKTAPGGFGGGRAGNNTSSANGEAAGNSPARGGIIQFGGATAGVNSDGNRPGGGGGSGYPAVGRQGAEGQVFFRARQP